MNGKPSNGSSQFPTYVVGISKAYSTSQTSKRRQLTMEEAYEPYDLLRGTSNASTLRRAFTLRSQRTGAEGKSSRKLSR